MKPGSLASQVNSIDVYTHIHVSGVKRRLDPLWLQASIETEGCLPGVYKSTPVVEMQLHCGMGTRHGSKEGEQEDEPYRIRKLASEGLGSSSTCRTHSSLM